jgi:hypothetical protein
VQNGSRQDSEHASANAERSPLANSSL